MRKLIVANWKLNPVSAKEAILLAESLERSNRHTVVICPPAVYLPLVKYPNLGAQDCFWQDKGAYTGQISPLQLKDLKVKYCIIGHSERRAAGETDIQVNFKLRSVLDHGIVPVLCVGFGTTVEQDDLEVVDVLRGQLEQGLSGVDTSRVAVAYEPVWAIGTGKNATPEHAEKIAIFLKSRYGVKAALYGGSVTPANAAGFLKQDHVGGLLVGGASLVPGHFNAIIKT